MNACQGYSAYNKLRHLPQFHGLELLEASYQDHVFPRHWNESFIIQLVEQGVNGFYCDGKVHTAPAGSIVLINAYEVHTGYSAGKVPLIYRSLYLTHDFLRRVCAQIDAGFETAPLLSAHVVHDARLAGLIRQIHGAAEGACDDLCVHTRLLQALSRVLHCYVNVPVRAPSAGHEMAAVRRAREYLHANYSQNVSLAELARHSYLSPYHLLRTFRKALGMPPHEYLTNLRIERAKRHLAAGIPISQVALQTGFIDQSHLHRRFKHLVGITPGQFLKMSNFVQDRKRAVH